MSIEKIRIKIVIEDTIRWTVNYDHIVILSSQSMERIMLYYPETALWDLITRYQDPDIIIKKMKSIFKKTGLKNIGKETNKTIQLWLAMKLIREI